MRTSVVKLSRVVQHSIAPPEQKEPFMEPEMTITFPDDKGAEGRYKGFVVRSGDWDSWYEGPPPSPFDLFVISIGLCAASNVFAFMTRRGYQMSCTRVVLHRHTDKEKKMIDRFTFEVFIPKDFPEKYRRAVVRALDACSVKKHIISKLAFDVEMKLCDLPLPE